jgi:HlyD family secretion protein
LSYQIAQLEDQLQKCQIKIPIDGTILKKYTEPYEMAQPGKALFKIADLDQITLKVYVTGKQLLSLKLGQQVKVQIDQEGDGYREMDGKIYWISSSAEFTPKTVQTKEERANKVYAVKLSVPNDGTLKIGMYGQIVL